MWQRPDRLRVDRAPWLMRPRTLAGLALLTVLTAAAVIPTLGRGLLLWDTGELVWYADMIADGRTPAIDYALDSHGPGRPLAVAGIWALLGRSLQSIDVLLLLLRIATTLLAWLLACHVVGPRWAALPVACLLVAPGPLPGSFEVLAMLALTWLLLRALKTPGPRSEQAFGLGLVAIALFRFDLALLGGCAWLVGTRGRPPSRRLATLAPLLGGLLLGGLGLRLSGSGVLGAGLAQIAEHAASARLLSAPGLVGPPGLAGLERSDLAFFALPLVVYPLLLRRALGSRPEVDPATVVVLLIGGGSLLTLREGLHFGSFLVAAPLLWLAIAMLLAPPAGGAPLPARRALIHRALGVLLVAALLGQAVGPHRGSLHAGSFTIPWDRSRQLDTELGPRWLDAAEWAAVGPLLADLAELPDGPLWVAADQPLLYGLSGRQPLTSLPGLTRHAGDEQRQQQLLVELQATTPTIAVAQVDSDGLAPLGTLLPDVAAWLRSEYREVTSGAGQVMTHRVRRRARYLSPPDGVSIAAAHWLADGGGLEVDGDWQDVDVVVVRRLSELGTEPGLGLAQLKGAITARGGRIGVVRPALDPRYHPEQFGAGFRRSALLDEPADSPMWRRLGPELRQALARPGLLPLWVRRSLADRFDELLSDRALFVDLNAFYDARTSVASEIARDIPARWMALAQWIHYRFDQRGVFDPEGPPLDELDRLALRRVNWICLSAWFEGQDRPAVGPWLPAPPGVLARQATERGLRIERTLPVTPGLELAVLAIAE